MLTGERIEELGEELGDWLKSMYIGPDETFFTVSKNNCLIAKDDGMVYKIDQNGGDYEGGAHALAQRVIYYDGRFEEIFGKELTAKLEARKDEWFNTLISLTEDEEKLLQYNDTRMDSYAVFRSVIWHMLNTIYEDLIEEDMIDPMYHEEWIDEFGQLDIDTWGEDDDE